MPKKGVPRKIYRSPKLKNGAKITKINDVGLARFSLPTNKFLLENE